MHAWHPQRLEEGDRGPGTGVTGGSESLCRFWESTPGDFSFFALCFEVFITVKQSLTTHASSVCCLFYLSTLNWHFCHLTAAKSYFLSTARARTFCAPLPDLAYVKILRLPFLETPYLLLKGRDQATLAPDVHYLIQCWDFKWQRDRHKAAEQFKLPLRSVLKNLSHKSGSSVDGDPKWT